MSLKNCISEPYLVTLQMLTNVTYTAVSLQSVNISTLSFVSILACSERQELGEELSLCPFFALWKWHC